MDELNDALKGLGKSMQGLIIFSLFSCFAAVNIWIKRRMRESCIKKALGLNIVQISKDLLIEIGNLFFISVITSLLLVIIYRYILEKKTININFIFNELFEISLVLSLMFFIILVLPICKIIKEVPIKGINSNYL